jgi:predicted nuclease of restriction endonuclease-like (RecB) superfamily
MRICSTVSLSHDQEKYERHAMEIKWNTTTHERRIKAKVWKKAQTFEKKDINTQNQSNEDLLWKEKTITDRRQDSKTLKHNGELQKPNMNRLLAQHFKVFTYIILLDPRC